MILVNEITAKEAAIDAGEVSAATVRALMLGLVQMLAPFAPFFAAELWELGWGSRALCSGRRGRRRMRSLHGRARWRFRCR